MAVNGEERGPERLNVIVDMEKVLRLVSNRGTFRWQCGHAVSLQGIPPGSIASPSDVNRVGTNLSGTFALRRWSKTNVVVFEMKSNCSAGKRQKQLGHVRMGTSDSSTDICGSLWTTVPGSCSSGFGMVVASPS